MVLNQRVLLRLSIFGVMVSAVAFWAALPARSCPPTASDVAPGATPVSAVLAASPDDPTARAEDTKRAFRADNADVEARLERLEADLGRIGAQLEAVNDALRSRGPQAGPHLPLPPRPPGVPGTPFFPTYPPDPRPGRDRDLREPPGPPRAQFTEEGLVVRSYQLSPGKLGALSKLMTRDDVPIRVRPLDDRIEVHATERNQAIFKGFLDMIHASKQARTYRVSPGKAAALAELMIRSDVPLLVEPDDDAIKVHGTSLEQSVFKAFLTMIDPRHDPREATPADEEPGAEAEPSDGEPQRIAPEPE